MVSTHHSYFSSAKMDALHLMYIDAVHGVQEVHVKVLYVIDVEAVYVVYDNVNKSMIVGRRPKCHSAYCGRLSGGSWYSIESFFFSFFLLH